MSERRSSSHIDRSEPSPSPSARDALLLQLLAEFAADHRAGQTPNFEKVESRYPELVDELRSLWLTARMADDFILSADDESATERTGPALQPVETGTIVGDYEVLGEVGRGGMGVVFKARQASLGRTVALKKMLRAEFATPVDVDRFRNEAQSAARLRHPHIVSVFEVGECEGQPFFTMQLIEGTTLAQRIAAGPLPPRDAAEILFPVCRAIGEAHRAGVLHRDLKPSNILIDHDGHPYVGDFGLAKRVASPTFDASGALAHSGAVIGTPGYMAPEQAAGNRGRLSPATDVYGLGALLYAMLTGRAPFQAASPIDTVLQVLEQDPLPPRLLNPSADVDLEMIALKCLQKPADLRYSTADELADDLEAYLANEPISARSSRLTHVLSRAFRETHHAGVLENWGLLWMWHSLVLVALCAVTNWFLWRGIAARTPYVVLWTVGLGVWAAIFWNLRRRSGPITFVERQVAHIWAGSVISSVLLFGVEALLDLPVLTLSPVLGLISGIVFLAKAGILSGAFYVQAVILLATAAVMAAWGRIGLPDIRVLLFGVVSAACFLVPGLKYYRQSRHAALTSKST